MDSVEEGYDLAEFGADELLRDMEALGRLFSESGKGLFSLLRECVAGGRGSLVRECDLLDELPDGKDIGLPVAAHKLDQPGVGVWGDGSLFEPRDGLREGVEGALQLCEWERGVLRLQPGGKLWERERVRRGPEEVEESEHQERGTLARKASSWRNSSEPSTMRNSTSPHLSMR